MSLQNIVKPIVEPGYDVKFDTVEAKSVTADNVNITNLNVNNLVTTGTKTVLSTNNQPLNTNSTNSLDVYGGGGIVNAYPNTFYGINCYYNGGFRALFFGNSMIAKQSDSDGVLSISLSSSKTNPDTIISSGPSYLFNPNGTLQIGNKIKSVQSYNERKNSGAQSIPNAVSTACLYQTQVVNTGSNISYNAGVFTVNSDGIYLVTWDILWSSVAGGYRETFLLTNTPLVYGNLTNVPNAVTGDCAMSSSCVVKLNSGNSFQIIAFQNQGLPLNLQLTNVSVYELPSIF